jgi:hypothetical protein
VERAGQRLLALLAVGSANAETYPTPLGTATRDAEKIRDALAALRDPAQRVLHELWANVAPADGPASGHSNAGSCAGPWEEAEHALGWSGLWAR